jgi:hypothetical protein
MQPNGVIGSPSHLPFFVVTIFYFFNLNDFIEYSTKSTKSKHYMTNIHKNKYNN